MLEAALAMAERCTGGNFIAGVMTLGLAEALPSLLS